MRNKHYRKRYWNIQPNHEPLDARRIEFKWFSKHFVYNLRKIFVGGIQGYGKYKVGLLSHVQKFIFGICQWLFKIYAANFTFIIHSSFYNMQICLNLITWQQQTQYLPVQMYVSFLELVRLKLDVQIHTYFYYRPLLIYYGAILFFLQFV